MILALILIILLSISLIYINKDKDILHPLVVYIIPICLQYFIYLAVYSTKETVSYNTILLYGVSIVVFFGSYMFGEYIFMRIIHPKYKSEIYIKKTSKRFFYILFFIGIILMFLEIYKVTGSFAISDIYKKMRIYTNYGEGYSFFVKYIPILYEVVYAIQLYNNADKIFEKEYRFKFIFSTAILFIFALFSFSRTSITFCFLMLIYILLYKRRNEIFKNNLKLMRIIGKVLLSFIIIILIFIGIAKITDKLGNDSILNSDFFLWKYLGYPLITLDRYIINYPGASKGYYILGIVAELIGGYQGVVANLQGILPRLGVFNVYTYIGAVYLDLGFACGLLFQFILALFISYIYVKNVKNGGKYTVFYAFYLYPILMSFYGFQYSLTIYIYFIICFILINVLNKITIKK